MFRPTLEMEYRLWANGSTICLGWHQRKHQNPRHWPFMRGNQSLTGGFPSQRSGNAKSVFILWRFHDRQLDPREHILMKLTRNSNIFSFMKIPFKLSSTIYWLFFGPSMRFTHRDIKKKGHPWQSIIFNAFSWNNYPCCVANITDVYFQSPNWKLLAISLGRSSLSV